MKAQISELVSLSAPDEVMNSSPQFQKNQRARKNCDDKAGVGLQVSAGEAATVILLIQLQLVMVSHHQGDNDRSSHEPVHDVPDVSNVHHVAIEGREHQLSYDDRSGGQEINGGRPLQEFHGFASFQVTGRQHQFLVTVHLPKANVIQQRATEKLPKGAWVDVEAGHPHCYIPFLLLAWGGP